MTATTIDEVIRELDAIAEGAAVEQSNLGYFAALYRRVTAAVKRGIDSNAFQDGPRMERLDVAFANRYLDAVLADRRGEPTSASWRVAFDACARSDLMILQHLYLGLNAHLLLDLGVAAAQVGGGDLAALRVDFHKINDIVASLMRAVDTDLGKVSPVLGRLDEIAGRPWAMANNAILRTVREVAWQAAEALAPLRPEEQAPAIEALDREVAALSRWILDPGAPVSQLVALVREAEERDTALVVQRLRGADAPRLGQQTGARRPRKKAIVLGGGVAGLSAAHELADHFEVHVYEAGPGVGGKARSQRKPGTGAGGREDLPGEHGFRFFPAFYKHVIDTMARIPTATGNVAQHLIGCDEMALAQGPRGPYTLPRRRPRGVGDFFHIVEAVEEFLADAGISAPDVARFSAKMLTFLCSCEGRRFGHYERISFWKFIEGDRYSTEFQNYINSSRFMVAMDARVGSARTIATKAIQTLLDFRRPPGENDRVLNGPTTRQWLDPWEAHLRERGVQFHFGEELAGLDFDGASITGARMKHRAEPVSGDYYVLAVPVERVRGVISEAMARADASLDRLRAAPKMTAWMVGAQFYLREDVPICGGHVAYPGSPWALSSISQAQFWAQAGGPIEGRYGDGTVRGVLSVDICGWDRPGVHTTTKRAAECGSAEEVLAEVWAQLKHGLNHEAELLSDDNLVDARLDTNVVFTPDGASNTTPLLVHPPGSWAYRPEATTAIGNLMLASDYVRTSTDLATMEGACEAARRAANAIFKREGLAARAEIWEAKEDAGWLVDLAKKRDEARWLAERDEPFFEGKPIPGEPEPTLDQVKAMESQLEAELRREAASMA